jgi:hypothetical protein
MPPPPLLPSHKLAGQPLREPLPPAAADDASVSDTVDRQVVRCACCAESPATLSSSCCSRCRMAGKPGRAAGSSAQQSSMSCRRKVGQLSGRGRRCIQGRARQEGDKRAGSISSCGGKSHPAVSSRVCNKSPHATTRRHRQLDDTNTAVRHSYIAGTDLMVDPYCENDLHVPRQLPPGHLPCQALPAHNAEGEDIHLQKGQG